MCLEVSKFAKKKIAKKDISCYKLLVRHADGSLHGLYYQDFEYKIGVHYRGALGEKGPNPYYIHYVNPTFWDYLKEKWYKCTKRKCAIEEGFHSYKNLKDAYEDFDNRMIVDFYPGLELYHCIIPKGASYYEGSFCGMESYASTDIIVVGKVD